MLVSWRMQLFCLYAMNLPRLLLQKKYCTTEGNCSVGLFLQNYSMLSSKGYDGLEAPVAGLSRERERVDSTKFNHRGLVFSYPRAPQGWQPLHYTKYHGKGGLAVSTRAERESRYLLWGCCYTFTVLQSSLVARTNYRPNTPYGGLWSVDPAKYTLRGAVDPAKYTLRGAVDPAKYTLRGAVDTAKYTLREAVDPDQNLKVLNRGWEIYIQYVPQLLQGLYINPELLTKFIKLPTIYKIGQTLLDSQYLYSFQCSQFSSVYAQYEKTRTNGP